MAELTALVERLAPVAVSEPAPAESASPLVPEVATPHDTASGSSRRGVLMLAGAAAVGAVAVAVAGNTTPAAAATGQPMLIGAFNNPDASTADTTFLIGGGLGVIVDSKAVTDAGLSTYGAALFGRNVATNVDAIVRAGVLGMSSQANLSPGPATSHGVVGLAHGLSTTGSGVYGNSVSTVTTSAGVMARSTGGPSVQLVPVASGAPTAGAWTVGALQPDILGNLWYCIENGVPGRWRNLTAPVPPAPPSFHPLTPTRVYDSRSAVPAQGVMSSGGNRLVSVASGRTLDTGAVNSPNVVPVGATAIACNVTVDRTQNQGFLAVNPGGNTTTVSASTINWFASNQTLANGVIVTISASREVTVIAGGGGATDFIIDVTGYFL